MNNDLISREALKEQINATDFDFGDYYDNTEEIRKRVCEVIDNASTVPLPNEQIAWEQGYEAGLAQGKNERPQGEYKTACNVLLSLEQIVRSSDGWEDSAVEAVHNAVQTAIKCIHDRPKGEWYYGEDECGQDGWFCSECNFFVPWYYQYYEKDINFIRDYKACPHCLAEMVTYTGKDRDMKGGAE